MRTVKGSLVFSVVVFLTTLETCTEFLGQCLCPAADPPFEQAMPGRKLAFPRDHGKHPEFETEWWYFTGNLESADGKWFGVQLTFFRRGLVRDLPIRNCGQRSTFPGGPPFGRKVEAAGSAPQYAEFTVPKRGVQAVFKEFSERGSERTTLLHNLHDRERPQPSIMVSARHHKNSLEGENHPMFQEFSEGGSGGTTLLQKGFPPEILPVRNQLGTKRKSAWAVKDLYMGHFAVADLTNKTFSHAEVISREGPGPAGAAEEDLSVRIRNWSADKTGRTIRLRAHEKGLALDLTLDPVKPPVLHGEQGFSRKGDSESQASYYYSFPRLEASGTLTVNGTPTQVRGSVWMDHEFASSILTPEQAGWDWFGLQLDDGTEVMVFQLRGKDGTFERPFGTFVEKDGTAVPLSGEAVSVAQTGRVWKSPHSGAVYPAGWTVEVPGKGIRLEVSPALADQELSTAKSTQVTYWEGSVEVSGRHHGRPVKGKGYVELTGYAHTMGGRL